ncbi:F1891 protein, partial [Picathartes gymnocephalus]|nr:F1891 protein [Picathartes gymnocephalus]
QFLPQRPHSANPDCMTPHGTVLHQTLDFDEGLHLDFPHSPFGALYEVTINSPGMLYPSELPPPYEAVIRDIPVSQVTGAAHQVSASRLGERNTAPDFSTQESSPTPPLKQKKTCCVDFRQPPAPFQTSPCFGPANTSPCASGHEAAVQQQHVTKHPASNIVRSSSAPVSCSSATEVPVSGSHMAASACQHSLSSFLPSGKQRDTRKIDLHLKPKAFHTVSKERPHSLVDLKAYKDTKILVAKFLEHSNCNLPPEVRHVVNSIRSVIKSDERHMEEAIFSANIIDQ